MPTEFELRSRIRDGGRDPNAIDVESVLRRARARRRPRVLAASGLSAAAALALVVPIVVPGVMGGSGAADHLATEATLLESTAPQDGAADADARAERPGGCEAVPAPPDAADAGLRLEVVAIEVTADGRTISVELELMNSGDSPLEGRLHDPPTVTLAADGAVVGRGEVRRAPASMSFDLAPGESLAFDVEVEALPCLTGASGPPAGGPVDAVLPPGDYELSPSAEVWSGDPPRHSAVPGAPAPLRLG